MEGKGHLKCLILFFIACSIPGSLGQTCDINTISVQASFDQYRFEGTWFYQSQLPFSWQPANSIFRDSRVIYQVTANGFDALWFAKIGPGNECKNGAVELISTGVNAKYSTTQAFNETASFDVSSWVVDTDYNNYAVVYGCQTTDRANNYCTEPVVATLSRARNPAREHRDAMRDAVDRLCLGDRLRNNFVPISQTGDCPTVPSACDNNPCQSGGSCRDWKFNPFYFCWCTAEFTGNNCQTRLTTATRPCDNQPCLNGGSCTNINDREYVCTCDSRYTGTNCEQPITVTTPCDSFPCFNGGTCSNINNREYVCTCDRNFRGQNCEQQTAVTDYDLTVCVLNPCYYGGKCNLDPVADYGLLCNCNPGTEGIFCQNVFNEDLLDPTQCQINPCAYGGICITTGNNNYRCVCPNGYTGPLCDDRIQATVNPCDAQPCRNGGTCNQLDNQQYGCTCVPGYEGRDCEILRGRPCDAQPCINGQCENNGNSFTCRCFAGYTGRRCENRIARPCDSNPCLNGGTCSNNGNTYSCSCPSGYQGSMCQNQVRPCDSIPCLNGGRCFNNLNGYSCSCPSDYTGVNCGTRIQRPCDSFPCLNGGTCSNNGNSYTCSCPTGYQGFSCGNRVRPCDSAPCINGGTCFNSGSSYSCSCPSAYTGVDCENRVAVDDCRPNPCLNGGSCFLTFNSFVCQCTTGYRGNRCQIGERPCDANPCANGGTCRNVNNDYRCTCQSLWTGRDCTTPAAQPCDSAPCRNGGTCRNENSGYRCTCTSAWTGQNCNTPRPTVVGQVADIFFLVDTSSSIGRNNFLNGIMALIECGIKGLRIGPRDYQVGVITFSRRTNVQIGLRDFDDISQLVQAFSTLDFDGQSYTNLTGALREMSMAFAESNSRGRQNVPKIGFSFMDGGPSAGRNTMRAVARDAHNAGIKLIAFGIGEWAEQQDLDAIASDPDSENTKKLAHFDNLKDQESCDFIAERIRTYSGSGIGGTDGTDGTGNGGDGGTQPGLGGDKTSFNCGFENRDLCGMSQSTNDQFNWSFGTGVTDSSDTGPNRAKAGDSYLYLEASSPRREGDQCILDLQLGDFQIGTYCFEMSYSMYGFHVDKLEIRHGRKILWGCKGDLRTTDWKDAEVSVTIAEPTKETLQVIGTRGSGYSGDIAIDDVRLRLGQCSAPQDTCRK